MYDGGQSKIDFVKAFFKVFCHLTHFIYKTWPYAYLYLPSDLVAVWEFKTTGAGTKVWLFVLVGGGAKITFPGYFEFWRQQTAAQENPDATMDVTACTKPRISIKQYSAKKPE